MSTVELILLRGRQEAKEENGLRTESALERTIRKLRGRVLADTSFCGLNCSSPFLCHSFKAFPEVQPFYSAAQRNILVSYHWFHHPVNFPPFVLIVKQRKGAKQSTNTQDRHKSLPKRSDRWAERFSSSLRNMGMLVKSIPRTSDYLYAINNLDLI